MRIGIGQINTTVCDIEGNARKIEDACEYFAASGADFAIFPELSLVGYSPKDAVLAQRLLEESGAALDALAKCVKLPCLIGFIRPSGGAIGRYNSAAWLEGGRVKHIYDKALFPNYDVFDEPRVFDSGAEPLVFEYKGKKIGVTVCEDIWTLESVPTARRYKGFRPLDSLRRLNFDADGRPRQTRGLDIALNISASVFSKTNDNVRKSGAMLCQVSDYLGAPLVWCNLVGGNDDLIFAGGGGAYVGASLAADGKCKSAVLKKFEEDFRVIDVSNLENSEGDAADYNSIADVHAALVMALRDFVRKSGFKKVILGLSGGIDSALVAALAARALGAENVIGVSLPSKISSAHSKDDARILAENLGIKYLTVPISPVVDGAEESLKEVFKGYPQDVTEENIQSRARGLLLMAMSNKFGAMLLSTGNKSECAVGYCTLYGDTCGGVAPISDLYKTEVYELSRYINKNGVKIPQNSIDKAPSAELRENQTDQDSLPPYNVLDAILELFIEKRLGPQEIVERGFEREVVYDVIKKIELNEYKRKQFAYGLKVTSVAFGTGRRMPLARKIRL